MAEKELRRMNRAELIEVIYALKTREETLEAEKKALEKKLQDRQLQVEQAGSIAEAALAVNDVFTAAQRAADDYLNAVRAGCADAQTMAQRILEDAQRQADALLAQARKDAEETEQTVRQRLAQVDAQCAEMKRSAEAETRARWDAFQDKVGELFVSYRTASAEDKERRV